MNLVQLLVQIAEGQLSFAASGTSLEELLQFEPIVDLLQKAQQRGLIADLSLHKECATGKRLVDHVKVRGGLTEAGKSFLYSQNLSH